MRQYCRYCAHCFQGDCFYCNEYDKVLSDSQVRKANTCERFALSDLGDVETGKQYKPRAQKWDGYKSEQLTMF